MTDFQHKPPQRMDMAEIDHFIAMKSKFLEERNWIKYIIDSTQDRASLHTSLVAAVEERKKLRISGEDYGERNFNNGYYQATHDFLTIINSIFKE